MRPGNKMRVIATALGASLLLIGCAGGLLPGSNEPPKLFLLTPKSTYPKALPNVDWQLTVDQPIAQAGLNTQRIALRRNPVSLEYFARASWVDTAPLMVQTLLVESFENSKKIVSVGRPSISLRADYTLITELREFQAEYFDEGPPEVRTRINAKIVKLPERIIIGARTFEAKTRSRSTDLDVIIHGFDEALGKVLKQVVIWTLETAGNPSAPVKKPAG